MSPSDGKKDRSTSRGNGYGTNREPEEPELDAEEERLYTNARALEFGDWNYPVINTHYATRRDRLHQNPNMLSQTTNRAILQDTKENRQRRKSKINEIRRNVHQHDQPENSSSNGGNGKTSLKGKEVLRQMPVVGKVVRNESSDSRSSKKSHSSQLVDLVVEDRDAEEVERVRARKEGGPGWNSVEQKHFVKTYPDEGEAEEVRQGFNPDRPEQRLDGGHSLTDPFTVGDGEDDMSAVQDESGTDETGHEQPWEDRQYSKLQTPKNDDDAPSPLFEEERNAWGDR